VPNPSNALADWDRDIPVARNFRALRWRITRRLFFAGHVDLEPGVGRCRRQLGALRDHVTQRRRPFVRFFACEEELSHESSDAPLPDAVARGAEPFLVIGAMAGG